MIFLVTYENNVESMFFHIWDAQQHVNFFDKEEQERMEILRVDEKDVRQLHDLQEVLKVCARTDNKNNHCCGNCGRAKWIDSLFICGFSRKEINPNNLCVHYI